MGSPSLAEIAERDLSDAGFGPATLERQVGDEDQFGNAEAVFSMGSLRFRFLRDRGQEFLELGSSAEPGRFFLVDDVEVAMGWRAVEEVLNKQCPDDLRDVLARVGPKRKELEHAFSLPNWRDSARRFESTAEKRGELFQQRLQQLAKPHRLESTQVTRDRILLSGRHTAGERRGPVPYPARGASMKQQRCPFSVGDTVCFTPSERTLGHYQDPGRFGIEPGDEAVIKEIRDDAYLYFDQGAGGWPWTEFSLVHSCDE